jgi:hypothetical protein
MTMKVKSSDSFLSAQEWILTVLKGEDVIVRGKSALECMGLFSGYLSEETIDVYSTGPGRYENVNYEIVDSFEGIECLELNGVLCTSPSLTFNELLADAGDVPLQHLLEGLADYYNGNGRSFDGLDIDPVNLERFNAVKEWAVRYYER